MTDLATIRQNRILPARLARLAAAVALAAVAVTASAAESVDKYPSRPVTILVPYAPGGATDIIARAVAQKMGEVLGQSFVVENRPGAQGNLAIEACAKAQPDGYTLLVGNVTTNAINEAIFPDQRTKPTKELVGISRLVEIPHVVVANNSFPPNDMKEVVAYAKKNPGKINFASAGLGSYPQLDMLKFMAMTGTDMVHIPYKSGASQIVVSIIAGDTQLSFLNLSSAWEFIKAGRMKVLATTWHTRLPELPNVATMAEQGFPGVGTNAWQGMFAPKAVPQPIVDKLYKAVATVLSNPETKENLAKSKLVVRLSKSPQDFTKEVAQESKDWGKFVHDNHIKVTD